MYVVLGVADGDPADLLRQPPQQPARFVRARVFTGTRVLDDFVVLSWDTGSGTIGWAHPLRVPHTRATMVARVVNEAFPGHAHDLYRVLVTRCCC